MLLSEPSLLCVLSIVCTSSALLWIGCKEKIYARCTLRLPCSKTNRAFIWTFLNLIFLLSDTSNHGWHSMFYESLIILNMSTLNFSEGVLASVLDNADLVRNGGCNMCTDSNKMFTVHSVHTKVISMTYQKLWMMIFVWCITVWLWTKANFANFRIRHHLIFSNLCQVTFHSKLSYPFILLCIFSLCPLTNLENLLLEFSSETLRY